MTPILAYVAHPLGPDGPARVANIERVQRWLAFLIARYPDVAFVVPWLPYAMVLDESPENRVRGMRDGEAVQKMCTALVMVGGAMSPGMHAELDLAQRTGQVICSLLHLGDEPPAVAR